MGGEWCWRADQGRWRCSISMRSAHRRCSLRGRGASGRAEVARSARVTCALVPVVVVSSPPEIELPPQPLWVCALGCDIVIEENGYPLGSDSFVSISTRRVHVRSSLPLGLLDALRVRAQRRCVVAPLFVLESALTVTDCRSFDVLCWSVVCASDLMRVRH